jgi:hypothetical protein
MSESLNPLLNISPSKMIMSAPRTKSHIHIKVNVSSSWKNRKSKLIDFFNASTLAGASYPKIIEYSVNIKIRQLFHPEY